MRTLIRLIPIMAASAALSGADPGRDLAAAARAQIGVTLRYDSRYQKLGYPGGDLPQDRGVCTDVIIRAYRRLGIDLQVLVHQDMVESREAYPNAWHMTSTDTNIDHRRVPNLATFFARHGQSLGTGKAPKDYLPGDLVTWRLTSGVPHIGIVSDRSSRAGTPLVIHNIGWGAMEEDRLFDFTLTGHYRYQPAGMGVSHGRVPSRR